MHTMEFPLQSKNEISLDYLRQLFLKRQRFFARFTLVSDIMSSIAVLSIILMVIANELTFREFNNQQTVANWSIKLIITILTFLLIMLILYYHYLDMKCFAYKNRLDNWHIQLTLRKIILISLEIFICLIHPFPRSFPNETNSININSTESYSMWYISIDVALGLPMFLRLYLLGRTIMLHSSSFRNITLRSYGYFNHVSINISFLIKSYLEHWPTRCLTIFVTLFFFIGSWSLRACNYNYKITNEHISMSDAMWLFVITFTTVGYGDLYPSTHCGRSVAAIIGLVGLLLSALLIAILTKKLLLSREQKYVHTFVLKTRLSQKYKHQAANIIKFTIKLWYLKRQTKYSSYSYFRIQQKLFRAIQSFQLNRQNQGNLIGSCIDLNDLMTVQQQTNDHIEIMQNEIKEIQRNLSNLNQNIDMLQKTFVHYTK